MKVLITICVRGGSKGIPDKNIKHLNGKPLLSYTFDTAFDLSKKIHADIQLSTDSEKILETAKNLGYTTNYKRPDVLASDTAGKIGVIRSAWIYSEKINRCEYDFVLDMDVTSPLRNEEDLLKGLEILKKNPDALNLFSVNTASRNPYFNMVEETYNGFVKLVKGSGKIKSRQQAPKVYDMNASFYIFTREFMKGDYENSVTNRSLIYCMPHICFDLDEKTDFRIMEIMLRENLLDFKL